MAFRSEHTIPSANRARAVGAAIQQLLREAALGTKAQLAVSDVQGWGGHQLLWIALHSPDQHLPDGCVVAVQCTDTMDFPAAGWEHRWVSIKSCILRMCNIDTISHLQVWTKRAYRRFWASCSRRSCWTATWRRINLLRTRRFRWTISTRSELMIIFIRYIIILTITSLQQKTPHQHQLPDQVRAESRTGDDSQAHRRGSQDAHPSGDRSYHEDAQGTQPHTAGFRGAQSAVESIQAEGADHQEVYWYSDRERILGAYGGSKGHLQLRRLSWHELHGHEMII